MTCDAGVATTSGIGCTVTRMETGSPTQPEELVSVTIRVHVPTVVQVTLMELPVPAIVPFPPVTGIICHA